MKDEKEQFLEQIEGTAIWRTTKRHQFSDDHNLEAAADEHRLYDFVKEMD